MALEAKVFLRPSMNEHVKMAAVFFTNQSKMEVVIFLMESFLNGLYQLLDKKGESPRLLSSAVM
jgi:hypothetical protein